jgi:hypothetical protein
MYMHSFHVKRVVVVVAVEQHAFATTRSKMQNARDIRLSIEVIVSVKFIELFFHSFLLSSKHQNTTQQQKAAATTSSAQTNKQSKAKQASWLLHSSSSDSASALRSQSTNG